MTTFKDRLEGIFEPFSQQSDDKGITLTWSSKNNIDEAKQAIIDLFLEIVGDDEPMVASHFRKVYNIEDRNELRAELRNKLKVDN